MITAEIQPRGVATKKGKPRRSDPAGDQCPLNAWTRAGARSMANATWSSAESVTCVMRRAACDVGVL